MAQHAPDSVVPAKITLPSGVKLSLVFDQGQPQGVPFAGMWWRIERYLPPANSIISALQAMLPAASAEISIGDGCTRAESAWYPEADLRGAVEAARNGALDAWWVGRPSAAWWAGLPADVRAGFMGLFALCRI